VITVAEGRAVAPDIAAVVAVAHKIFSPTRSLVVERMADGGSTFVYRVGRGDERFYLRVLPEIGDTCAPEVRAHALLRERGVRVPEVIYHEPRNEVLGLSVLVTTEIAGRSVAAAGLGATTPAVLLAAGRDLAIINSVAVAGFGWVRRDCAVVAELTGERASNRAFLTEELDGHLALIGAHLVTPPEIVAIRDTIARHDAWLDAAQGSLAHGDLDATHIYQDHGRYTGIIDFGEMRGTDRWYDLGHFAVRDGERIAAPLLPWLLAGYAEITPLPDDQRQRIAFAALLIGIRLAARSLARRSPTGHDRSAMRAIERGVTTLA